MIFSLDLIKKLIPDLKEPIKKVAEDLSLKAFETEVGSKTTLEVSVPPNRFSDAASHWGLAREVGAIYGLDFKEPQSKEVASKIGKTIEVKISEPKVCTRLAARVFENIKIGPSPKWMQDVLIDCGMRPINNLVDITNYVTLETGQPLHAFDLEKIEGEMIEARYAKKNEVVELLDGKEYTLDTTTLVLADQNNALDVAGVKGGKKAEITSKTKTIVLTAGNFDGAAIYKTVRKIKLATDASSRFSHNISAELVLVGIRRASELIEELCGGQGGEIVDVSSAKKSLRLLKFDIDACNEFSGLNLKEDEALKYLLRLGFAKKGELIEVPALRTDIDYPEDLFEEVVRLYGYKKIKATPPTIAIIPREEEDRVILKDNIRNIISGLGFDEVYNSSFVSEKDIEWVGGKKYWEAQELENPVSAHFSHLRPSLAINLFKNILENLKYQDLVKLFEIGKAFGRVKKNIEERLMLALAITGPHKKTILELKGVVDELMKKLGIIDSFMRDANVEIPFLNTDQSLRIEVDHHVVGFLGVVKPIILEHAVFLEIDCEKLLTLISEEKEYEPLPKYPSIMRDLSLLVGAQTKVDTLLAEIQNAGENIDDVDLVDFYEDEKLGHNKKSLTFRIVFLSRERTLTDDEVNVQMDKIIQALRAKFKVEVR